MTIRDSLGAQQEPDEERSTPSKIGETFKGDDIHEDEVYLEHLALVGEGVVMNFEKQLLFEDDVYEYVETLDKAELIEIVKSLRVNEIINLAGMEEVRPAWNG